MQKQTSEFFPAKSAIDENYFPYRKVVTPANEKIFYQQAAEV
jgi:hypothetical protein